MTASPLAKKLGLKPNMRALIVRAPEGYLKLLAPLPDGVTVSASGNGMYPFVQLFATRLLDIHRFAPELLQHADAGTLVWIAYPKKTSGADSDLNRDILREAINEMGWHTVSIVAIDDFWSALRFRPGKDAAPR